MNKKIQTQKKRLAIQHKKMKQEKLTHKDIWLLITIALGIFVASLLIGHLFI